MSRKKKRTQRVKNGSDNRKADSIFRKGVMLHQQGELKEALDLYREVLQCRPDHADALYLSGVVFHQAGNDASAVEAILKALTHSKNNEKYLSTLKNVYNNKGLIHQEKGEHQEAIKCYEKALEIDDAFPLALNNLAMVYYETGAYQDAVRNYERVIEIDKTFFQAWLNLGLVFNELGKTERALACYETAQHLNPESWQVLNNIGIVYKNRQKYKTAVDYFKKAIELNPVYSDAYYNLGCTFFDDDLFDESLASYSRCIELDPGYLPAYTNIGNIYLQKKMYREAEKWYLKAVESDPFFADAYNNLGTLYNAGGDSYKAIKHLTKAVELKPESPVFLTNLGLAWRKSGNPEKAVGCFKKTITLLPEVPEPYFNLGESYRDLSLFSEAIECFVTAVDIDPEFKEAYEPLAYLFMRRCQWKDAEKYKKLVNDMTKQELQQIGYVTETPHNCLIRSEDPELCYRVAKSWGERIASEVQDEAYSFLFNRDLIQNRKIRVAYLSNTFRDHPGGHLIAGVFGAHNREEFEVFAYSYGVDDGSYYRKKVEAESDRFIELGHLNDLEAAECIHNDQVDILIDLRGFTMSSRIAVCALKPAPIQVAYLGFPGSSGAGFFDYIIADKTVIPEEHMDWFSEKIVYMPDCYQINNDEQVISDERFNRKDAGLPEDGFVFCSFNTDYKLEPEMFGCWMEILKRTPGSVLWLLQSGREMVCNLEKEAEKRGVAGNRLVFADRMAKERHLNRLQLADLALDTRINGHTTTSDALWAGLPLITIPGRHFASRVSASILDAAGLPELIAATPEQYKTMAVELAKDRSRLQALKEKIQRNKGSEPFFDTARFTRNIEKGYKIMWDRFVKETPPSVIEIK